MARKSIQEAKHKEQVLYAQVSLVKVMGELGDLARGTDPGLDALRDLAVCLLTVPQGQWSADTLPVPLDWSALPQPQAADALIASGRKDALVAAPWDWTKLSLPGASREDTSYHRSDFHGVIADQLVRYNSWLASRLTGYGLGQIRGAEIYRTPDQAIKRTQVDILSLLESVGIGPDTCVSHAGLTGVLRATRLVDVALAYEDPRVIRRLLASARWNTPQQASDTLLALAVRSTLFEDKRKDGAHPGLVDGSLIQSMLDLHPDPAQPVAMSWRYRRALGLDPLRSNPANAVLDTGHLPEWILEQYSESTKAPPTLPLAFVVARLAAFQDGVPHRSRPGSLLLSKWSQQQILAHPELLNRSVHELILPVLARQSRHSLAPPTTPWSFAGLVSAVATASARDTQVALAQAAFTPALDAAARHDDRKAVLLAALATSFPLCEPFAQGALGIPQAQALLRFLAKHPLELTSHAGRPAARKRLLACFEPGVQAAVDQRWKALCAQAQQAQDVLGPDREKAYARLMLTADLPISPSPSPSPSRKTKL